jgi:hypothetical protein
MRRAFLGIWMVWPPGFYGPRWLFRLALTELFALLTLIGADVSWHLGAVAALTIFGALAIPAVILLGGQCWAMQRREWRCVKRLRRGPVLRGRVGESPAAFPNPADGAPCVYSRVQTWSRRGFWPGIIVHPPNERAEGFEIVRDEGPPVRVNARNLIVALHGRQNAKAASHRFAGWLNVGEEVIVVGDVTDEPYVVGERPAYREPPTRPVVTNAIVSTIEPTRATYVAKNPAVAAILVVATVMLGTWIISPVVAATARLLSAPLSRSRAMCEEPVTETHRPSPAPLQAASPSPECRDPKERVLGGRCCQPFGLATICGVYDRETLRQAIRKQPAQLDGCYQAADDSASVQPIIDFTINPNGSVAQASVLWRLATKEHPHLRECIASIVRTWHFPKPPDGLSVFVRYPLFPDFGGSFGDP